MSKQDSQHVDQEREVRGKRRRVAKPFGLRVYWKPFWKRKDGNPLSHWTKWYSSVEGRANAKKSYLKGDFYVKAEEVGR